jgi:hypothetical protein
MPTLDKNPITSFFSNSSSLSPNEETNIKSIKPFISNKVTIKDIINDTFEYIKKLIVTGCYKNIYFVAKNATNLTNPSNNIEDNGNFYSFNSIEFQISEEIENYINNKINELKIIPFIGNYNSCYNASVVANTEFYRFVPNPSGLTSGTNIVSKIEKPSNLSYYITVKLSLYPADMPKEKYDQYKCDINKSKIQSSIANLLDLQNPTQPINFSKKGGERSKRKSKKQSRRKNKKQSKRKSRKIKK